MMLPNAIAPLVDALAGAAPQASDSSGLGLLVMTLLGGLALFLYGMEKMSDALRAAAGHRLKDVIASLTRNRILGALSGAITTAVIQSSSVTTVLVVGFISAGLMTLTQSVAVIMGANVGTTLTAQVIAFNVTQYALLLVALGFAGVFLGRSDKAREYGAGVMGLGLVFYGMGLMSDAMAPLQSNPVFLDTMSRLEQPALGILVGALFTALVQSSSATTGVAIVLAAGGMITLPAGIALTLGANIGTCVTAVLASIGKSTDARRAAAVHVLFNVIGAAIWLPFLGQLAELVTAVSPAATDLSGIARTAAETPRQIANGHTIFNVVNTLLFLPFTTQLARLAERLVPEKPASADAEASAKFLDEELLETPALALDRVRLEILRQGTRVHEMVEAALPAVVGGSRADLDRLIEMDDQVDVLHAQIVEYLGKLNQTGLLEDQTREFLALIEAANSLENIGDIVETNMVTLGHKRIAEDLVVSEATRHVLESFSLEVRQAVDMAIQAVTQHSKKAARQVIAMKPDVHRMMHAAAEHQTERLVASAPDRLATYALETDIMQSLLRIYYFAKRMARGVVPSIKVDDA